MELKAGNNFKFNLGNYRIFRLKRGDLNLTLEDFLVKFDAARAKIGFPQSVFLSDEDAAVLRRNNRRKLRKQYPDGSKHMIDHNIGSYWLQYGPSSLMGKAIRPGYVFVDIADIDNEARKHIIKVEVEPTLSSRLLELVRTLELGGFGKK